MRIALVIVLCTAFPVHGLPLSTAPSASPSDRLDGLVNRVQGFDCANVSCKRLGSCAEACHKLLVCGQRVRDGDNDGIPCENLCAQPC